MNQKTILLIEDRPEDVELTLRAFGRNRGFHNIVVLKDGVEALDYLFSSEKNTGKAEAVPHLILLDLKLPKIDGLEVLKRIRGDAKTRFIPVVLLTCSLEEEDLIQGYKLGVNSYIRKPIDEKSFMSSVQQLGLYWLIREEATNLKEPEEVPL